MGSSTAYALARQGRKVALLEQFHVGHRRGSSHGRSRIFRFSYPDALYVALVQESLRLWRALEGASGERLIITTGGLDLGESIEKNASALKECGVEHEIIDGSEVRRRFGEAVAVSDEERALFQPDAGVALADKAVEVFFAEAVRHGADVRERSRVVAIEEEEWRAVVRTESETFVAPVVVVTAGAWAKSLLEPLGIELVVIPTRQTVAYFGVDGSTPPPVVEWGARSIYAVPSPGQGIKGGEHHLGPATDPDRDEGVDVPSVDRVAAWVGRRFPRAARVAHLAETCLYTNTPDEHFVLERHGAIVVGSACSGHGFKFAPLVGERLATLALA